MTLTAAQRQRLRAIFPNGVRDWKKPGVERQKPVGTRLQYRPAHRSSLETRRVLVNSRLFRHVVFHGPARLAGRGRINDGFNLADGIRRETA